MLRRNVKISWGCFLRPQGLTPELMKLMARAGLAHIEFGSDSFCDEVLAAYQKDFTFDDILHSSELASREKVDFCHFLICGGPGETQRDAARRALSNRSASMARSSWPWWGCESIRARICSNGPWPKAAFTRDTDLLAAGLLPGARADGGGGL